MSSFSCQVSMSTFRILSSFVLSSFEIGLVAIKIKMNFKFYLKNKILSIYKMTITLTERIDLEKMGRIMANFDELYDSGRISG